MEAACCSVELEEVPLDCCLSPAEQLLGVALIGGRVETYSYSVERGDGDMPNTVNHSKRQVFACPDIGSSGSEGEGDDADDESVSCRALVFTLSGQQLLAGYVDHSVRVLDVESGKIVHTYDDAHADSVERLLCVDSSVFASGSQSGEVCLWDMRTKEKVYSYKKHTDYISDFTIHYEDKTLVAVSGDGTLTVHDLKNRKCKHRSEDDADDELLSVASMKRGKKLVCGTQSGVLNLYSWGSMNDCSDRFPGHPESVQALAKFDEDTLFTGSGDGVIRIVNILPNKLLGVLGEHGEFPIERLAISADKMVLASAGHDEAIRLWDLTMLQDDEDDGEEEGEEEDEGEEGGAALAGRAQAGSDDDGEEGEEEGEEDDEDEEGDEGEEDEEGKGEGSEGEEEGDEDGEEDQGAGPGPGSSAKRVRIGDGKAQPQQTKAKGKVAQVKKSGGSEDEGEGGGDSGDGGDGSGDGSGDSDSDGSEGGRKKKRVKKEKTKWTKGMEVKEKTSNNNFFADLL